MILKITGWKTQSVNVSAPKYVLIGAPHTSNWDFVIGYMLMSAIGLKLSWVGKHTLFRGPLGWLLHRMGGIPVNRSLRTNFVDQMVASFDEYDKRIVTLAPEGTRKYTDYWKSGFYYIALETKVPVVCGFVDYSRKIGGTGLVIYPTGDPDADLEKMKDFYTRITPKFPENCGEIKFRPKNS
jgi:1-acyl-sn-glycerol-3-phosphate acyltransferase